MYECRYQTDEGGRLVYFNAFPEKVEKMYKVKCAVQGVDLKNSRLSSIISKMEYQLFRGNGALFALWCREYFSELANEISSIASLGCCGKSSTDYEKLMNRIKEDLMDLLKT